MPNTVEIFSDEPAGTVIAQDPKGGISVVRGGTVRVNISKGQQTIGLPNVIGQSYDSAATQLRTAGLTPVRRDVDATEPKGTVVDQDPAPGSLQPPGTKITLSVSKGATTTTVPDVTGDDEATAQATLENDGWRVVVRDTVTDNPDEDGIVLSQTPAGGAQAKPGARITLYVARFQAPTEPPPPTTP